MDLIIKGLNGASKSLTVGYNATVGELKQLISRDFRVSPPQQKLSANNGHRIDLEDDSKTLSSYGLHPGSTVMLIITNPRPFQVFVKNEKGSTGTYEVAIDETVDQLKCKVFNKERVPVDQQRLIYNGRQLESGKKLQEYDITSESTIHMALRLRGG
ncbi:polyubiquitin-like [Xyrauchen texanus]|uniref:polyubiquitin-like n=1 Tax=Xyrauchen texanus TaxID=154827 RepID=UPI0022427E2B|nr:polyubiquitin-like [Xyrauchen texanus]